MADTKVSAAADPITLVGTDKIPIARSGSTVSYAATMAEVAAFAGSTAAGVTSFNTRTGAVTLSSADVTSAGGALLASPTFTGTPNLPTGTVGVTQTAGNNSTALATTAFVTTALTPYAPLAAPVFTGDARAVTSTYGDSDTSIATTAFVQSAVAPLYDNVGRNLLHNPLFNVWQRGGGPFTTSTATTLDRWFMQFASDTLSVSGVALPDADRVAVGDESALLALQATVTGNAAAGAFSLVRQSIEALPRLSGKTVTVSFYAKAASGSPKIGVSIDQSFGTGGSPSAPVYGNGQAVTISTTLTRYSVTLTLPSSAGKTYGSNGDHCTQLNLWLSSGATLATRAGSIGVQSAVVSFWGVQLEIGTVATPLEKPDPQQDLAKCQRFFQSLPFYFNNYGNGPGAGIYWNTMWPVVMRAAPSMTFVGTSYANASGLVSANIWANGGGVVAVVTAAGNGSVTSTMLLSADL